jgi:hypothetical protein
MVNGLLQIAIVFASVAVVTRLRKLTWATGSVGGGAVICAFWLGLVSRNAMKVGASLTPASPAIASFFLRQTYGLQNGLLASSRACAHEIPVSRTKSGPKTSNQTTSSRRQHDRWCQTTIVCPVRLIARANAPS